MPTRLSPTTDLEQRVLAEIRGEDLVEMTSDLVRYPSFGGDETPVQLQVVEHLKASGCALDVWSIDLDALRAHPGFSMEIERAEALGVVGTIGRGDGPTLLLDGHVDVVPAGPPELWTLPPFEPYVRDGRLHGRGSVDMKGGLVAAIVAARAVGAADVRLAGTVHIASVIGEEDGGVGTLALIDRGYRADGAIVMEPTNLEVVTAQAGCRNFRVRIPGRAAHGALRTEGESAIEHIASVLHALRALESARCIDPGPGFDAYEVPFPISVGCLRAGTWASSVPEEAILEGRFGLRVGEDPEAAMAELESAVAGVGLADPWLAAHPATVEWWGGRFESARTEPEARVVRTVLEAHAAQGGVGTRTAAVPYGADMGLLVRYAGIPTVLYGPGDVRDAHRADEFVPVDALVAAARTLALTMIRFCGTEAL